MSNIAWYYHTDDKVYYWTESYTMSVTQFALEVSDRIGKSISASDVSACSRQAQLDIKRRVAKEFIYINKR